VFPNPQDALPLPAHPSLEQYRKLAKDLVKACKSGDPDAIGRQTERWLASLSGSLGESFTAHARAGLERAAGEVEEFTVRKLTGGARQCVLADAQFVIARSHGFDSWPKFAAHLDALAHSVGDTSDYEAAADAIVAGDEATLRRLLRANPGLIHARSTREHRVTLLHYVSANGVEGYRQKTPKNITDIARLLLDAGAEVDAEADVYGGGSTTLGLVATSAHPRIAGVQQALMQLLINRGAQIERRDLAGNGQGAVMACLANGCPEAAEFLADRVARLGLVEAAGVGRLDQVRAFFDARGLPAAGLEPAVIHTAFRYACFYGRNEVVAFLAAHGVDLAGHDGDGQTGLHYAAMGGMLETIELLLRHGSPLEAVNTYGGTVLEQAAWSAAHGGDPEVYVAIVESLIAAGAQVPERHPPVNAELDAVLSRHGSVADDSLFWFGEEPRHRT
jgi:ankyrin repeat protein